MTAVRRISSRVTDLQPSATVAVSDRARALKQQGQDIISLAGGDPDFDTPAHIREAATEAMRMGHTHYVSSAGLPSLRKAISDTLRREQHLEYDPACEIIVTPGGKLALFAAVMCTVGEGDQALILDPSWVSYEPCIQLAGASAVHAPLQPEDNFVITQELLEAHVTSRCRLMIVNSPNNPTGRALTRDELTSVANVAVDHDLWVISDEIYDRLIFDGHEHHSLVRMPGMRERTIIINGFSKTYAMTGWRLGWLACPSSLAQEVLKVQQHSVTCATSFVQHAGVAALTGPQEVVAEMVDVYRRRRDMVVASLNRLPNVSCHLPEGAFYAFPDISGTGMSSLEFAEMMLNEAGVAVTPGIAFGRSADRHVRLSFATSTPLLEQAMQRMARAL